ncbi:hypothetical protein ACQY0O_004557 [Thecaphora frezii]
MAGIAKRRHDQIQGAMVHDNLIYGHATSEPIAMAQSWQSLQSSSSSLCWDSDAPAAPVASVSNDQGKAVRPKKRGRVSTRPQPPFVCFCGKQFKRHEHMSRHKATHSDEMKYECPICGKGFRRQDVMHRHTQTHTRASGSQAQPRKASASSANQSQRQTSALSRAGRACLPCKRAKLRCDGQLPCSRCVCHPNRECHYQPGPRLPSPSGSSPDGLLQLSPLRYEHSSLMAPLHFPHHALVGQDAGFPRHAAAHQDFPSAPYESWTSTQSAPSARYSWSETNSPRSAAGPSVQPLPAAYCVPTQPAGTVTCYGAPLSRPMSEAWSPEPWDGQRSQSQLGLYQSNSETRPQGESFEMALHALEHQHHLQQHQHQHQQQQQQQHHHWSSLSDSSIQSEVGTPPVSNPSYAASPFVHSAVSPPPPPPAAYTIMCQSEAKDESPYASLVSSTDTSFYHFGGSSGAFGTLTTAFTA